MDLVADLINKSTSLIDKGGPIVGFLLVMLESFIPILPLAVFVALNVNAYGMLIGLVVSWSATCLGCYLSYLIFYYVANKVDKFLSKKTKDKIDKTINRFSEISLPFTPAFLINILSGLTKVQQEKFVIAILIGKVFSIAFWGYIGKSFIESMMDIKAIAFIILALIMAYVVSKIVSIRMHIE